MVPQVFVQEIKITNMRNSASDIEVMADKLIEWPSAETKKIK